MATIGTIAISVQARTKKFMSAMNKAIRRVKRFGKSFSAVGRVLGKVGGLFTLIAGGGIGFMIKKQLDLADSTNKAARMLGMETEELIAYRHMAELAGVDTGTLESSLTAIIKRLGEARAETGPLITFMKKYDETLLRNIQNQKNASGALALVADAIKNAANEADAAAIANAAFSRQGVKMVEIFRDEGSAAIEKARKETEKLNIAFGDIDASKAEMANDAMTRLKRVLDGIFLSVGFALAPVIKILADRFTAMATEGESAGDKIVRKMQQGARKAAEWADAVNVVRSAFNAFFFAVFKGIEFLVKGVQRFFGIIGKAIEKITGKNPFEFLEDLSRNAAEAAEKKWIAAGDALGQSIEGRFQKAVDGVLKDADALNQKINTKARTAAEQASRTIQETVDKNIGFAKQIDPNLVFAGGVSSVQKEQKVRVEQLDQTNNLLSQIKNNMGGGAVAA